MLSTDTYVECARGECGTVPLVQYASDIVTVLEANGAIPYESPAVARILGYRPEELVGKNAFDYVRPDDLGRMREGFVDVLTTTRPS